jgi:hypothetical protein
VYVYVIFRYLSMFLFTKCNSFLKMIVINKTYFYLKTIVVVTFVTQIHETSRQIKKVKIKIKSNHLVL